MNRQVRTWACIAGLLAVIFIWYTARDMNIKLVDDSMNYIEGARFMDKGMGHMYTYDDRVLPQTAFPPVYSVFIVAALNLFGDLPSALFAINIFCSIVFCICWVYVMGKTIRRLPFLLLGLCFMVLNWGMWYFAYHVMSEMVGLFMMGFMVLFAYGYIQGQGKARAWYAVLLGLAGAGLFLARYAGAGICIGAGLFLLLYPLGINREKIRNVILFGLPLVLIGGGWFIRNKIVSSNFSTIIEKYPSAPQYGFSEFSDNVTRIVRACIGVPERLESYGLVVPMFFAFILLLAFGAYWALRRKYNPMIVFCSTVLIAYLSFLLYFSYKINAMPVRYLIFVVPLVSYFFIAGLEAILEYRGEKWIRAGLLAVMGVFTLFHLMFAFLYGRKEIASLDMYPAFPEDGIYTEVFSGSPWVPGQLKNVKEDDVLMSNLGRYVNVFTPHTVFMLERSEDKKKIEEHKGGRSIYLIMTKKDISNVRKGQIYPRYDYFLEGHPHEVIREDSATVFARLR